MKDLDHNANDNVHDDLIVQRNNEVTIGSRMETTVSQCITFAEFRHV